MPLLGNPTAAVLYPGKLVFALFAYPLASRLYIIGHTLLAFAAMIAPCATGGRAGPGRRLGALALRLRRADPVPVQQHHLPGRRRLGPSGISSGATAG